MSIHENSGRMKLASGQLIGLLTVASIVIWSDWSRSEENPGSVTQVAESAPTHLAESNWHWAYRPIRAAAIPDLRGLSLNLRSPIDALVLAQLPAEEQNPAKEANRITLIRRTYFDLIGFPPSPEEIDEFIADENPDAFERLVDRLLASPHFGVRWGRHWLSVARFGESLTLRGLILPEAWRYRDYVIESFNSDLPFDRFVIEQIAGDLLPADTLAQQQRQRIATTFLVLGNHNLEEQDKQQLRMDVVDEQLEAIGKGFLSQTIGCARCHDHKFDPISTRDYYAMAGIFANVKTLEDANVSKWLEFPLPLEPDQETIFSQHETLVAAVQSKIKSVLQAQQKRAVASVVEMKDLPGTVADDRQAKVVGDWQHSQSVKPYIDHGYLHDKNEGKGEKAVTLQTELSRSGRYEVRFAYTAGDNRCEAVPVTVFSAEGEKTVLVNQKLRPPIEGLFISLGQFRFEANGQAFVMVETKGTTGHVIVDAVQFLPEESPTADAKNEKALAKADTLNTDKGEADRLSHELQTLTKELQRLQKDGPKRPRYMSVKEEERIGDIRIHVQGTVHQLGNTVPRGFPQVMRTSELPSLPSTQSGRKEFGEWIASRDNPLAQRVIANRIWCWLFGTGLSRTPDNFGTTGEEPSHPELLDRIAVRLLERDWSIKPVIRELVTSRAFRQASLASDAQQRHDPENRLLLRHNRRRLDAECLLDTILTVSGARCDEFGGSTINAGMAEDYGYNHVTNRRAVYWPVFRNSLPEIFEAFDFPDPSVPSGIRNVSTVAPQSLFFLNNRWVTAQARQAAQRLLAETHLDTASRIDRIFRLIVGRRPDSHETQIANEVVSGSLSSEDAWTMVIRALFASIDFRYVE